MLNARVWKTSDEMIDALTKENGGIPLTNVISGQPLTKEYWDELKKEVKAKYDAHVTVKRMGKLKDLTFL